MLLPKETDTRTEKKKEREKCHAEIGYWAANQDWIGYYYTWAMACQCCLGMVDLQVQRKVGERCAFPE